MQMDSSEQGELMSGCLCACPGHTKVIGKCLLCLEEKREAVFNLNALIGLWFQAAEQSLYLKNFALMV